MAKQESTQTPAEKKPEQVKQNALQRMEQELNSKPNIRSAMSISFVKDRYINNYEAITGRKDGENKFFEDLAILTDMANENPKINECDKMSIAISLIKVGSTNLSLKAPGHLYLIPMGKHLKCQIGAHGKKEMLRQMPDVKFLHEAVVVVEGDIFKVDKLNNRIIQHETTDKSVKIISKLEDIKAAYVRMEYKNGRIVDMIVPFEDLLKARNASKNKSEGNTWVTWTAEMCKKVTYHRLFKNYYRYPDKAVLLPGMEVENESEEDTKDVKHTMAEKEDFMETASGEQVNTDTGEVKDTPAVEAQVVKEEPAKKDFMD